MTGAPTNAELADWLMSRVRRYVPGLTGHDWDERDLLKLIASRLREQAYNPIEDVGDGNG